MSVGIFFSLRLFYNDSVQRSASSCQPSKCEEDDGYARKPRRQRKAAVRSGFPTRHWLILPLGTCVCACVWETRLSQRFQFFKHLLTKCSAPGASRTGPLWLASVAQRCRLEKMNEMAKRGKASQKDVGPQSTSLAGCHRGCSEVYLGNSTSPSARFQELVTSSQSQLTYETRNVRIGGFLIQTAKTQLTPLTFSRARFSIGIKLEYVPVVER